MRIACFPSALSSNRNDQWATCRCEGRAVVNMGFGFGEMGHNVDIVSDTFEAKSNVYKNVSLIKSVNLDTYYDIVLTFNLVPPIRGDMYGKLLFIVNPDLGKDYYNRIRSLCPKVEFMTMSIKTVDWIRRLGVEIRYLPVLYPIPCLDSLEKQDFMPFKFEKNKEVKKVWVFIGSWKNYYINVDNKIVEILRRLRDFYGFKMEVTVMARNDDKGDNQTTPAYNQLLSEFKPRVLESLNMCYLDVINELSSSDICITKGGWCYCGNCCYDIVSLGKLMFYVTQGLPANGNNNINDVFPLEDYVIRHEDQPHKTTEKIDRIMSNPGECYSAIRGALETYSFPIWSKIVSEIICKN